MPIFTLTVTEQNTFNVNVEAKTFREAESLYLHMNEEQIEVFTFNYQTQRSVEDDSGCYDIAGEEVFSPEAFSYEENQAKVMNYLERYFPNAQTEEDEEE